MAKAPVETCPRGHNDWGTRRQFKGGQWKTYRRCNGCRNNGRTERARRRAASALRIPSPGGKTPAVPWPPLEAAFTSRDLYVGDFINERNIYRWRKDGISLFTADEVCCRVLHVHPHQVYGDSWFSFGEETA